MTTIAESGVRPDLVTAHCNLVAGLGEPGAWWNAHERIAIAAEVRRALGHPELAPWQAPSTVDGLVDAGGPLPEAAVDAIWRLTNHPGTLTHDWYVDITAGLPSVEHYVELVALVAALNAVERFAEALDLAPLPLPEASDDPPSHEREAATVTTHWVPTAQTRGPNVLKALSALPSAAALSRPLSAAQYVPPEALLGDLGWSRGTLSRQQIELVAAQTSLRNECFY